MTLLFCLKGFLETQTEELQQWWEVKQQHWTTVLVVKDGEVFNTRHMDADIVMKYANEDNTLMYNAGEYACVTIGGNNYGKVSETLTGNGFRVARVEKPQPNDTKKKSSLKRAKNIEKMLQDAISKKAKTFLQGSKI